jgi:hypothetical protein
VATDLLSINTAPLTSYLNKKYYDLDATIYIMQMLMAEEVVDGFEFKLLAEWNPAYVPLSRDAKFDREIAWENSPKYAVDEIGEKLNSHRLPVLSVHANSDVGVCLCSEEPHLIERGIEMIARAISLAQMVNAEICVFHVWDPWLNEIDFPKVRRQFEAVLSDYPEIKGAVENIPTYVPGVTPYAVAKEYRWITLDTKWALRYGELDSFKSLIDKIIDIHIHGRAESSRWALSTSHHSAAEILATVESKWGYHRLLTLDTEGTFEDMKWKDLVSGIASVRDIMA